MAEYIEREAAIELLHYYADEACSAIVADMEALPAADVAPVVHGRWIGVDSSYWKPTHSTDIPVFRKTYRCSECGRRTAIAENYCPNCGARMDADTQEREGSK